MAQLEAKFSLLLASKPRIILGTASQSRRSIMDQLAKDFGFSYDVRKADIDEKAIRHDEPGQLVMDLAHAKADAIVAMLQSEVADLPPAGASAAGAAEAAATGGGGASCSGAGTSGAGTSGTASAGGASPSGGGGGCLLITCDQVVVHEGRILEKPEDADEARAFIRGYARSHAQTVGSVLCTLLTSSMTGGGSDSLREVSRIGTLENCTIVMDPIPDETAEELIAEGEVLWCAGGLMVEHPLVAPRVRRIEGGGEDSVMGLGREAVMRVMVEAAEAAAGA